VNYVLVGAVVLVAGLALLAALVVITGRRGSGTTYFTHYRNVTGLRDGAPVFYEGYRIGQVGAITPERSAAGIRYRVELVVDRNWPIPKDSVARLTATGLLADVAVGIHEGSSPEFAPPGAELVGRESADVFTAMNELAGEIGALTRDQIAPWLRGLTQRVDSITGEIDKRTPDILAQSHALLTRLNVAAASVNQVLTADNRAALGATLVNLRRLSGELNGSEAKLDEALAELNALLKENRAGVRESVDDLRAVLAALSARIDSITQHLEVASRNFDEFAREVRKSPNRLLLAPKGDAVEEDNQ
jgi:phospholipid/cholesterol/gamma-HCH transport system substrate-binding protein